MLSQLKFELPRLPRTIRLCVLMSSRRWEGGQFLSPSGVAKTIGAAARSRNSRRDCQSLCWQNRQQDDSDHKDYDHIGKVPVDAVNPRFHGLNSHHSAMGDVPPSY